MTPLRASSSIGRFARRSARSELTASGAEARSRSSTASGSVSARRAPTARPTSPTRRRSLASTPPPFVAYDPGRLHRQRVYAGDLGARRRLHDGNAGCGAEEVFDPARRAAYAFVTLTTQSTDDGDGRRRQSAVVRERGLQLRCGVEMEGDGGLHVPDRLFEAVGDLAVRPRGLLAVLRVDVELVREGGELLARLLVGRSRRRRAESRWPVAPRPAPRYRAPPRR